MFRFFINQDDRKIITISGLTLTALILLSGFSVYKIMQSQAEAMVTKNLNATLENIGKLINTQITHAISNTQIVSEHILLTHSRENAHADTLKLESIHDLIKSPEKKLVHQLLGISIFDAEGRLLLTSGVNSSQSNHIVKLDTDSDIHSHLLWDKQFILRNSSVIQDNNKKVLGRIVTEASLPYLTELFSETARIGKTDELFLCASKSEDNSETNCFQRNSIGSQFKHLEGELDNILPTYSALREGKGVKFMRDYRQIDVVAAHSPTSHGLGVVLKIDEKELYGYLAKQGQIISLFLALLVISGIAILRSLTLPLIQKSITSRDASILTLKQLINAKHSAEKISSEFAYVNAIGKLASISIVDGNGNILQVNDKLCEISGYTREELIGKDHRLLSSHSHSQSFFADIRETTAKNEVWHQEVCNRNKSGTLYWLDTVIIPIVNAQGKIDCYLSASVDITARKHKDLGLHERLKENQCLQMIRNYMRQDLSTEKICQNILDSLILAMQFPDMAVAMIELGNKQITTAGYTGNHSNKISAKIISNGEACGLLEIAYQQDLPFIVPHEQSLADTIAHDLGRWYERKEAEQRIIQMTTHDALTGLPNRHLLQDRIEQALVQDSRNQKQLAVLFIDLDHFKTINDSLGHDIGDLLLKAVAERLLACVRNEDTVARQGGDEFIVVLNSIAESLDAAKVSQKILGSLTDPYYIHQHELHIGGSIGIAVFPNDGANAETLLKNSDVAMYYAKENGRNNYQFFTDELNKSAHERHTLGLDLRHALERNELVLYYQPVMDMPDNQLHSVEALLRWRHPEHKLIAPDKFINLAEETGLIIPIGEWVLKTVCAQIKAWQNLGYKAPRVAINLSGRQFRDKELINNISRILNETGVDASYITLEITESMLIDNIEKVVETLKCLNEMGIQISIDDFGTGYSSLSYLKRFPIHTLKIDRSFVRDIVTDKNDHTIVAAIIAMAHSLEIEVIAEGIETEEQLSLLMSQKCNHYQGYYFSKPVPISEIETILKKSVATVSKIHAIR